MRLTGGRFLCALHPGMRAGWAPAWARLLKPGGELITLMFPLPPAPGTAAETAGGGGVGETKEEGPPWPLTPQLYRELLLPNGALLRRCHEAECQSRPRFYSSNMSKSVSTCVNAALVARAAAVP